MRAKATAFFMAGLLALPLSPALSGPALAADADHAQVPNAEIDGMLSRFFALLKAGQTAEAYDATLGASPLMAGKTLERQQYLSQLNTALQIYGPVIGYEPVEEQRLGSMVVRRYYVAQHEKLLTRWEIVFERVKGGWIVAYLGFEDQVRTWQ